MGETPADTAESESLGMRPYSAGENFVGPKYADGGFGSPKDRRQVKSRGERAERDSCERVHGDAPFPLVRDERRINGLDEIEPADES